MNGTPFTRSEILCFSLFFSLPRGLEGLGPSLLLYNDQQTHSLLSMCTPKPPKFVHDPSLKEPGLSRESKGSACLRQRNAAGRILPQPLPQRLFCTPRSTAARYDAAAVRYDAAVANRPLKAKELTCTQPTARSSRSQGGNLHPRHQEHFNLRLKQIQSRSTPPACVCDRNPSQHQPELPLQLEPSARAPPDRGETPSLQQRAGNRARKTQEGNASAAHPAHTGHGH